MHAPYFLYIDFMLVMFNQYFQDSFMLIETSSIVIVVLIVMRDDEDA